MKYFHPNLLPKLRLGVAVAALLGLTLAAAFGPAPDTASAQDGVQQPYVDLEVLVELKERTAISPRARVWVRNRGTATAYDVEVVVVAVTGGGERQQTSVLPGGDVTTLSEGSSTFLFPQLEAGAEELLSSRFTRDSQQYEVFGWLAEVRTRGSYESETRLDNNVARAWHAQHVANRVELARPNYSLTLAARDHVLADDGTQHVNVIVTAQFETTGEGVDGDKGAMDARVVMEFAPGLQEAGAATFGLDVGVNAVKQLSDLSYQAGVFNIGQALDGNEFRMTLPVRVTSGASLENPPCVTATIKAEPLAGFGPFLDDPTDNVDKVCFTAAPAGARQVLRSGTADLFTWYDCVGRSAPPCDRKDDGDAATNDDLQLVVFAGNAAEEYGILQPSQVVVHVPDPAGRAEDQRGGIVWSTGFEKWGDCHANSLKCLPGDRDRPGVVLVEHFLLDEETTEDPDQWSGASSGEIGTLKAEVTGPGQLSTWYNSGGTRTSYFGAATNGVLRDDVWWSGGPFQLYAEFGGLGTYQLTITIKSTYDNDTGDTTAGVEHTDTETYTFHVGPLADLSVAGGASAHVASNRNTLTIVAANNGPSHSLGTKVNGLPTDADVLHISQGRYDSATGVWNIGELKHRDYRRSAGQPEHVTLALSASAGDTADVTITNSPAYSVCIDSTGYTLAHTDHADCKSDAGTTNVWHTAVCVKDSNQKVNTTATHDTQTECEGQTAHTWTANVCATSASRVIAGRTEEEECDGWFQGTVYDPPANNTAKISARRGALGAVALRTTQSTANIDLSWPEQPAAAAYGVEVSEDDGATWAQVAWWVRGTKYTHTGVPRGQTRHYRVHAIDENGNRGQPFAAGRAVAGGAVAQASPPGAPEQMTLSATPASRTAIRLSWVRPEDYGSAITGYTLQVADRSSGPWANVTPLPGVNYVGYDYGGLSASTRKYFRIRATNEFGSGLWSKVASATTVAAGTPDAPRDVSAWPFGENAVQVNWNSPENEGGAAVTQYEVQWSPNGSTGWSRVGSATDTTLRHTGLKAGQTYYYRVRARNSAGWGPWSDPAVEAVAEGVELPGAPSPRPERNGSTALDIMWEPPWDEDEGGEDETITGYQLQWSPTGQDDDFRGLASPSATDRSYTHTGLKPDTTYWYRMRARNSVGWGKWSEKVWESTESAGVPSAPTLTALVRGSTEVSLSWTKPDGNGARIDNYELEYTEDLAEQGWFWVADNRLPANATHQTHSGLSPGTRLEYRIRANNENGPGQWSTVVAARTDNIRFDAPAGLTATAHDENQQIRLSWNAVVAPEPVGNEYVPPVTGYRVESSRFEDGPWQQRSINQRGTAFTDSANLYPGMRRYYRVAASNGQRAGEWSEVVSATTVAPDGAARAPDPPQNLRFTSVGQNQVSFAWDRPASDGGAPITGYEYQETVEEDNVTVPATVTRGTIRGLEQGWHYSFRVRAVNAVGEGDWSDDIYTQVWPERNEQVRVSATNITVTEGGTARFTVSLNRQPPLPVSLGLYPRGSEADDLLSGVYEYSNRVLIPNGWSHLNENYREQWRERSHGWSSGIPVSVTIPDDDVDNPDRVMVIDLSVGLISRYELDMGLDDWNLSWGIDPDRPCQEDTDETCPTEWDQAVYRDFTGPSVKITVRDND